METKTKLRLRRVAEWLRAARERPRPTTVSENWRAFVQARRKVSLAS